MRCRPYRWPQTVSWTAPELVCRAVRLVLDGALDNASEADLGARLGVSARHLRRLFKEQLGVTPDGLARSARVHFARRLLDDTDLTVTQIALRGRVRQPAPVQPCLPGRLPRVAPRAAGPPPQGGSSRRGRRPAPAPRVPRPARLAGPGPRTLSARAIPGVEAVEGDTYRRTIVVRGRPGVLELGPGGDDHLLLRAHLPNWDELVHVVQRARRIGSLDFDLSEPAVQLAGDPTIGPLLNARPGLRPPGTWDPFETGVRAIIGQQVTLAGANTIAGRLVARLGTSVPGLEPLGLRHTFPSAAVLARGNLDGLGLTPARARAVRLFARAVVEDAVVLDGSVGLDRLVSSITALDGLGPWTANYLALRLGEPDACPTSDLALRRALPRRAPTAAALGDLAERWRPWRALAATHLWIADGLREPVYSTAQDAA